MRLIIQVYILFQVIQAVPVHSHINQVINQKESDETKLKKVLIFQPKDNRLEHFRKRSLSIQTQNGRLTPELFKKTLNKLSKTIRYSEKKNKKCLRKTNKSWIFVVVDCNSTHFGPTTPSSITSGSTSSSELPTSPSFPISSQTDKKVTTLTPTSISWVSTTQATDEKEEHTKQTKETLSTTFSPIVLDTTSLAEITSEERSTTDESSKITIAQTEATTHKGSDTTTQVRSQSTSDNSPIIALTTEDNGFTRTTSDH